jgi:hypothetical protein
MLRARMLAGDWLTLVGSRQALALEDQISS